MSSSHGGRAPDRMVGDEAWSNNNFRWLVARARWRGSSSVQLRPRGSFYMRVRGLVQQCPTCAHGAQGHWFGRALACEPVLNTWRVCLSPFSRV